MTHSLRHHPAGRPPVARQHGALRYADGGRTPSEAPAADDSDIRAYESLRRRVAAQPADIQSMTHVGDRPKRPVEIEGGLIGKTRLGMADYDRAGPMSGVLQAAYDFKTAPLYATPAAPLAAAADITEGFASGDPLQAGLGALGTPGRAVKAAGMAAATMMPSEAEASWLTSLVAPPRMQGALARAEQMLARSHNLPSDELQGVRRQAWQQEGWFKDPQTGQWIWETPDRGMIVKGPRVGHGVRYLPDFVEHPELLATLPDLKDIRFRYENMGDDVGGYYTGGAKPEIAINSRMASNQRPGIVAHELGHGISDILGMPPGGTPTTIMYHRMGPTIERGNALLDKRAQPGFSGGLSTAEARELAQIKADVAAAQRDRGIFYDLSHGEARSRLSQADVGLTEQQRRARIPFESYRAAGLNGLNPKRVAENSLIIHPPPEVMAKDTDRLIQYATRLETDRGSP